MKKKIIYVLPDLSVIGAQRLAIDYGVRLQANGYNVNWYVGSMSGGFLEELDKIYVLSFSHKIFSKIKIIRFIEKIIRLLFLLRSHEIDIIISITPFYNRIICAFKMLRLISPKVVIEDHAYPPRSYLDEFGPISRFFYVHTEFLYKKSERFRVLSEESKFYYDKSLGENLSIVQNNYLNINRISDLSTHYPATLPEKLKPRIIYIGRFTTQKNIQFLIYSFALLLDLIDSELCIIGYGPEEVKLKRIVSDLKIESNVLFVRSSKNNFANLKTADLFPIVSIWEGMPLVVFEAMALKVPVIATNFMAGPKFIIGVKNERGVILDEDDKNLFAKSMYSMLKNIDGLNTVRINNAYSFVHDKVEIEKNFKNYIDKFIEY